jgi:hypothetical protein
MNAPVLHPHNVDHAAPASEIMNRALSDLGRVFPADDDEFAARVRADLDAIAKPKVRITRLWLLNDPKPLRESFDASLINPPMGEWALIEETFCDHFGCEPADVDMVETEDGDRVAVRGEIVGFVTREVR